MVLDHPRNSFMRCCHCRQPPPLAARPTSCLCWFIAAAIERPESIYNKISIDLGRHCCHQSCSRLFNPYLGHKKIWWYKIRCMGLHSWFSCSFLVGAMGCYYRAFCRGIYWRDDRQSGFETCTESGNGFLCRFPYGFVSQTRCMLFYALLHY